MPVSVRGLETEHKPSRIRLRAQSGDQLSPVFLPFPFHSGQCVQTCIGGKSSYRACLLFKGWLQGGQGDDT